MKDGPYHYMLEMTVPLGKRNGRLDIEIRSGTVTGYLTMFTDTQPISGGTQTGNGISFAGVMRTLARPIPYTAEGIRMAEIMPLLEDRQSSTKGGQSAYERKK